MAVNFIVSANHRVKVKESEDRQILRTCQKLKKEKELWNIRVTVILVVISELGTVIKGFEERLKELEIRGRNETTRTTQELRSARRQRRILESRGDLLSLRLQWNSTSQKWCKNSPEVKIIIYLQSYLISSIIFLYQVSIFDIKYQFLMSSINFWYQVFLSSINDLCIII